MSLSSKVKNKSKRKGNTSGASSTTQDTTEKRPGLLQQARDRVDQIKASRNAAQESGDTGEGRTLFGHICNVLKWLLLPVMFVAVVLNTVPYVEMMQAILPAIIPAKAILGILVFAAIQLLEVVLLFLLFGDRDKLTHNLASRSAGRTWRKQHLNDNDPPAIKRLKLNNNVKPHNILVGLMLAGAVTYFLDFGACIWHYPPLSGVESMRVFAMAPSLGDVDWSNFFKMLFTLFAFEFCVGVFIMLHFAANTFGLKEVANAEPQ